jgi:hypothetical protein
MRWRTKIAQLAGLPPLELMEGFYVPLQSSSGLPTLYHGPETKSADYLKNIDKLLPISWSCLKPDPIHILLNHSDCEGEIAWSDCGPIADRLEKLLPLLPDEDAGGHIGVWRDKTTRFISGLWKAHAAKENVNFH